MLDGRLPGETSQSCWSSLDRVHSHISQLSLQLESEEAPRWKWEMGNACGDKPAVLDSGADHVYPPRAWQPTPVFLPGESQGQSSLAGYGPWGRKESDMTE